MQKKLAAELTDLAHNILRMSDKEDVLALKNKAGELYEKLSVLAYVDYYIDTTPQAKETKQEIIAKLEAVELDSVDIEIKTPETTVDEIIEHEIAVVEPEKPQESIEEVSTNEIKTETNQEEEVISFIEELNTSINTDEKFDETSFLEEMKQPTLEEELKDTLSVDVTADLFTKAETQKSLNDYLQRAIQIGLNDRIAFVKHLFNGNQNDFNRVVSQLNTMDDEKEAKKFITRNVKPEYDWSDKEEYENRFMEIVERRFT